MDKHSTSQNEIEYIPIPRHLLPAFYRALAIVLKETSDPEEEKMPSSYHELFPSPDEPLIKLITSVARKIGADQHEVSLKELRDAYERDYPNIGKGKAEGSLDATLNYHCINMRSRFPVPADKRRPAYWLSHPVFKRVARGKYMLLSDVEIDQFRRCVEANHPLIYADEYDVADLAQCSKIENEV